MPTNYTPNAANNPAEIALPSDLEPATAESVNAALRALGDKSAFAIATRAALSAMNTFLRGQIVEPTDEGEALLSSSRYPSGITPDNRWAQIFHFAYEDNRSLRMYTGGASGLGRMAWTCNANWNLANQQWELEDDSGDATAIIWRGSHLSVYHVPSGTAPFATWPTTSTSDNGSIRTVGEFQYTTPKTRIRTIPLRHATGQVGFDGADGSAFGITLGDHSYLYWPIQLPPGAVFQRVKVLHYVAESSSETFRIMRLRTVWDEGDPTTSFPSVLVEQVSSSSTGNHITTLSAPGTTVSQYDELYLIWEPAGVLHGNVHAITVEWVDPGPTPI